MTATAAAATVQATAEPPLEEWIERFHRDGFLIVENVLSPAQLEQLRGDLDNVLPSPVKGVELQMRVFETSRANLKLFEQEPIVTFAERLIADGRPGSDEHVHVVHNNAIRTNTGGGISEWHQDDPPHYRVTHGKPPTNVRLPVLLFTCNYYLTDVTELEQGPTQFVPGSHLFGAEPPNEIEGSPWAKDVVSVLGRAGTALLFNCQVWHRGAPNLSDQTRYVTQVSYAHRIIGHRYYPFMNYTMPEHVYAEASPRLRRLLGFLPHGPYG